MKHAMPSGPLDTHAGLDRLLAGAERLREVVARLRAAAGRAVAWVRRELAAQRAIRELRDYDARALRDIGLTRGQIELFVREGERALRPRR